MRLAAGAWCVVVVLAGWHSGVVAGPATRCRCVGFGAGSPVLAKVSGSAQGRLVGAAWARPGGAWGRPCGRLRLAATSARLGRTDRVEQGRQRPLPLVWAVWTFQRFWGILQCGSASEEQLPRQGRGACAGRGKEGVAQVSRDSDGVPTAGRGSAEDGALLALGLGESCPAGPRSEAGHLSPWSFLSRCPLAGAQGRGVGEPVCSPWRVPPGPSSICLGAERTSRLRGGAGRGAEPVLRRRPSCRSPLSTWRPSSLHVGVPFGRAVCRSVL